MSRDISPDVSIDDLTLRLDMTALYDFEERAGITVSKFLSPIIGMVQDIDFSDWDDLPGEEKNRAGLDLIKTVLSSGVIAAKNLLILAWAMAGGEDLEEAPREFGRRINWQNRIELAAAFLKALKTGSPDGADGADGADEDSDEVPDEGAGEDPLPPGPE